MAGRSLEPITTEIRWLLRAGDVIVVPGQGKVKFVEEHNGEVVYETEEGEEGSALVAYVEKHNAKKKGR
jgi:hypothetical protein